MDADILAERILLDLKNILKKDPLIDEFDVLPVHESHSNTCPVIHIEHKVALEDWCVKHVYVYAYSKFFAWRKKPYKVDSDSLLMWTSAILLINPEIETVWNARKELVCQNLLLPENELKFSELVLSRKPKSSPVYAHRKWVLLELQKGYSTPCSIQQTINHELYLCTRFANLYPNNYYAWCHRSWVLKEMSATDNQTVLDELSRTEKWASVHVSDHCGLHYRQFLLTCLCNAQSQQINNSTTVDNSPTTQFNDPATVQSPAVRFNEALRRELDFLGGLQTMYPGHEALWYHRRYILHEISKSLAENTADFTVRSSFRNATEASNVLRSNSAEFKVHSSYGNTDVHGNGAEFSIHDNENAEIAPMEGCKRHKLECSIADRGPIDQDKSAVKGTVHCKRHKVEFGSNEGWGVTEEEGFLRHLVLLSREGDWERTLVKRHVKWALDTLRWSLSLS